MNQEDLDPTSADPRELMRSLLPAARAAYIQAWEALANAATPRQRRLDLRATVGEDAARREQVVGVLTERAATVSGEDKANLEHLAAELARLVEASKRLVSLSTHGVATATDLRPDAVGCGRKFYDPTRPGRGPQPGVSRVSTTPKSRPRGSSAS